MGNRFSCKKIDGQQVAEDLVVGIGHGKLQADEELLHIQALSLAIQHHQSFSTV
ncbi:hypothetical protein HanPSC8_Chr04g0144291 [Helianthus annuus]|nr:hypothetical protein HanPSC8_Chr04g0144291 [Helianthus annuus]